jgi:hypothetical protein
MTLSRLRPAFAFMALLWALPFAQPSLAHADDFRQYSHDRCSRNPAKACSTTHKWAQEERKNAIVSLYQGLVYPSPKVVLQNPAAAGHIFEQSVVKGRVTPAGEYSDFEGAIEYFYGLALTPALRVDGIKMRSLVASDDKVSVEVDIHFCNAPFNACNPNVPEGGANHTLRQIGFYTFNSYDRVISFDLTILNLGKATDAKTAEERTDNIVGVCTVLTTAHFNVITEQVAFGGTCTSQFDGPEDFPAGFPVVPGDAMTNCIAFMNSIPYGTWDQAASNTFTCRALHSLLTPLRDMHCMHVNVDGGGKCVDHAYGDFFTNEY